VQRPAVAACHEARRRARRPPPDACPSTSVTTHRRRGVGLPRAARASARRAEREVTAPERIHAPSVRTVAKSTSASRSGRACPP
jgi:hypothetical protein